MTHVFHFEKINRKAFTMRKRNLLFLLFLFLNIYLSGKTIPDTLKVGYMSVPPFVIERDGNLEGISVWLWEKHESSRIFD